MQCFITFICISNELEEDLDEAYEASIYLFTNEVPLGEQIHPEKQIMKHKPPAISYSNHQIYTNGFHRSASINEQEDCQMNISKFNQNNNLLSNDVRNMAQYYTGDALTELSEEAYIMSFDPSMLH